VATAAVLASTCLFPMTNARAAQRVSMIAQFGPVLVLDRARLARVPRSHEPAAASPITVEIDTGHLVRRFQLADMHLMPPDLARRFPAVRALLGVPADGRTGYAVLTTGPSQFRLVLVEGTRVTQFLPTGVANRSGRVASSPGTGNRGGPDLGPPAAAASATARDVDPPGFGEQVLAYRIAVAATGEYTAARGGSVEAGLAAVVADLAPVAALFEREVGVRLTLIENSDRLIYMNSRTDPYTRTTADGLARQNQGVVDDAIGSENYDVGHLLHLGYGGQAVYMGEVCRAGIKASAISSWAPETDARFWHAILAHELGHQFAAGHTYNDEVGRCGMWRRDKSAWEPGWGASIMSYGGVGCGEGSGYVDTPLPYFHAGSRQQIRRFMDEGYGRACVQPLAVRNSRPLVDAGPDYVIPARTPFSLTGTATDADGDSLELNWEQMDLGAASPPMTDDGTRPLFRFFAPTADGSRVFPQMGDVRRGVMTVGETYPETTRALNFYFTAMDGRGGVGTDAVALSVVGTAGPFRVIAPSATARWRSGRRGLVRWSVAGTQSAPIRCRRVDIELSVDDGRTFAHTLATATRNSGRARVPIPTLTTRRARVRVTCADNVFFALSPAKFTIER